ncbi:MAG: hypothetical protein J0L82_15415 [Deltaproteobacteria bacterium]|nr:hypothetical protein [Deltaproteobacteria bacterium]
MSAAWFEDQPNESYKARVEKSADREIENLAEADRRSLFSAFFNSWRDVTLTAGWASGIAAITAVWLVSRNESKVDNKTLADQSGELDIDFQKLSVEEFSLVADLDLLEDLDILELISDEDLDRGGSES